MKVVNLCARKREAGLLIKRCARVLPWWVNKVVVSDDLAEEDDAAHMNLEYSYRTAFIFLHRHFFARPLVSQREAMLHELAHCLTTRGFDFCSEIIDMFEDPLLKGALEGRRVELCEEVTEDLAITLARWL